MIEKVLLQAVLVFVVNDHEVLLARKINNSKKILKIGVGRWNGYGGGIEAGESPVEAAMREVSEETQSEDSPFGGVIIRPEKLKLQAVIYSYNQKQDGKMFRFKVYVFIANEYHGVFRDSNEMICASWFPVDQLPWEQMIPTDCDWILQVLKGEKLIARVFLGNFQLTKLKETQIRKVSKLSN